MKKVFFAALLFFFVTNVQAQLKLGFGLGYVIPSGDVGNFVGDGFSYNIELGYEIVEQLDLSIIGQTDILSRPFEYDDIFDINSLSTWVLNGRYYFRKKGWKPYGSLGVGFTKLFSIEGGSGFWEISVKKTNFSFRPSLGFKYGVLNINAVYLNAGKINNISVNDISINIGFLFTLDLK